MDDFDTRYAELKDDLVSLAVPLLEFTGEELKSKGNFLPFGASLTAQGEVRIRKAVIGEDKVSPVLLSALREVAAKDETIAVAVCEWSKVTPEGKTEMVAIKVHIEHANDFIAAYYVPCRKSPTEGWQFGQMMVLPAKPEIRAF
jgi:hypothetical protein